MKAAETLRRTPRYAALSGAQLAAFALTITGSHAQAQSRLAQGGDHAFDH